MKRVIAAILVLSLLVTAGCSWLVPGPIKREASIVCIDVDVAIEEIQAMADGPQKDKALRTLKRLQPHLTNIDNYMQGKQADRPVAKGTK